MAAQYVILITAKLTSNTPETIAQLKHAIYAEDANASMEFVVVPAPTKEPRP